MTTKGIMTSPILKEAGTVSVLNPGFIQEKELT
jgi:hypothetical protein